MADRNMEIKLEHDAEKEADSQMKGETQRGEQKHRRRTQQQRGADEESDRERKGHTLVSHLPLCIEYYIRETRSYRKIGGRGVVTEGQREDGGIQFWGQGEITWGGKSFGRNRKLRAVSYLCPPETCAT